MGQLLINGEPIGNFKGVLFDKDGTLSHSEIYLQKLCNLRIQKIIERCKSANSSKEIEQRIKVFLRNAYGQEPNGALNPAGIAAVASRSDNLIATATILCLFGETWPQAIELAEAVFKEVDMLLLSSNQDQGSNPPLPGVKRMLKNLHGNNIICALISNDTSKGIQNFISKNNLSEFLANEFWSSDHIPSKPNPDAIKGLCKSLALDPSECVMIGDSDSDLGMAKKANIGITIGYLSGWQLTPTLKENKHVIHHWDELTVQSSTKVISI